MTEKKLPGRVHMLGICGTAMVALAGGLKALGVHVTGTDNAVYPPMSDQLSALGIPFCQGYAPENIPADTDLVIVGNVIRESNPEAEEMRRRGLPYLSMAEAVYRFLISDRTSIVISGTHGKTTTSSLAAHTLTHMGAQPGFLVGGIARNFDSNFALGGGKYFVIEGDEYDTAYFDKTPKFFKYHPTVLVVTSLEFDHADIYPDLEAIRKHFVKLVQELPADGLLVAHVDDPEVAALTRHAPCQVVGYGETEQADCRLKDWQAEGEGGRFTLDWQGTSETWNLPQPGKYNALNATAVRLVAGHLGFSPPEIVRGFAAFTGVKRRQEVRGEEGGVTVLDDFAHHPTAVRLTIAAIRAKYPGRRVWAVFEPRSFTARSARFQDGFAQAFTEAERVVLAPPFRAEGNTGNHAASKDLLDTTAIAAQLTSQGHWARAAGSTDEVLNTLLAETAATDVVLVMSNGGFDGLHDRLLQGLRARNQPTDKTT